MKIIVGLGNPGAAYSATRHNVGRRLVEYAALRHSVRFSKKKALKASCAPLKWDGEEVLLAYPENFMNLSGLSVDLLIRYYEVLPAKELLVVVDDVALPYGRIRLRPQGSDGGHNGLKSIHQALQTTSYARLRIGIQSAGLSAADSQEAGDEALKEFVLSPFSVREEKDLPGILAKGFEACQLWLTQPFDKVMSAVNPFSK